MAIVELIEQLHPRLAAFFWFLLLLFTLRVLGQLLVASGLAPFLPAMQDWYSGAIAYPVLLASQILIILLLLNICVDFSRGRGLFVVPRRRVGSVLIAFGAVYLAVMVIRYAIRMSLYPAERWTGGSIPIFFHWVLAAFVLSLGLYHRRRGPRRSRRVRRWLARALWAEAALVVAAGVIGWIAWQLAPALLARQLGARQAEFAVRIERSAALTTADGTTLVADIYHPVRARATPTILVRAAVPKTSRSTLLADLVGRFWAERGYTVVFQGTRGRFRSGGTYYPLRHERRDGIETLAWIAKQPWFDGRLGLWGVSVLGHAGWTIADQARPSRSALAFGVSSGDVFSTLYPGGAFALESALAWAVRSQSHDGRWPSQEALERGFDGLPLIDADNRTDGDTAVFNHWVTHTYQDDYWTEIENGDRITQVRAPALILAGWFDPFLPEQLADFDRIRRAARGVAAPETRLIVGPWAHARAVTLPGAPAPRNYWLETLALTLPWFDEHLRPGEFEPEGERTAVRLFVLGANTWRDEREWPLARARQTVYYLRSGGKASTMHGDGILEPDTPVSQDAPDSFRYDPMSPVPSAGGAAFGPRAGMVRQDEVETRTDVLVYTTPPLSEDTEVTGPISVKLFVSTSARHTDFTAKLVDVHGDGTPYNVTDGILRKAYEPDDEKRDSAGRFEIAIDLRPTSMLFRQGHRIRLEISSSSYPRYDRNPNTGREIATETDPTPASQSVHHGVETPSQLILPIVPR